MMDQRNEDNSLAKLQNGTKQNNLQLKKEHCSLHTKNENTINNLLVFKKSTRKLCFFSDSVTSWFWNYPSLYLEGMQN